MNKKRKTQGLKSKIKTTPENGKCTRESLKRRNQSNLGPKPIVSSTKQVLARRWVKHLEEHQA
jgi:hypothetical protein